MPAETQINSSNEESQAARIFVACLEDCRNALAHGRWIDADQGAAHIEAEIEKVVASSPTGGRWGILKYEGFHGLNMGTFARIEDVAHMADMIEISGELAVGLYRKLGCLAQTRKGLEDDYVGQWPTFAAFAESWMDREGHLDKIPAPWAGFLNFEAIGRTIEASGSVYTVPCAGMIHVFSALM